MLSGPAILRISVLLLIAGVLAALVQFLMPSEAPTTFVEPPAVVGQAEPAPPPDRPAPASPAPAAKVPEAAPIRRVEPPARMPSDALAFPPATSSPTTSPPIPALPIPAAPLPQPPRGEAEIAKAEADAGPRALALVDLNSASVADLNRLQGGGTIGRAIVSKRPYASIDQLMSKRVLSRAVYDRIKAQVTVR